MIDIIIHNQEAVVDIWRHRKLPQQEEAMSGRRNRSASDVHQGGDYDQEVCFLSLQFSYSPHISEAYIPLIQN